MVASIFNPYCEKQGLPLRARLEMTFWLLASLAFATALAIAFFSTIQHRESLFPITFVGGIGALITISLAVGLRYQVLQLRAGLTLEVPEPARNVLAMISAELHGLSPERRADFAALWATSLHIAERLTTDPRDKPTHDALWKRYGTVHRALQGEYAVKERAREAKRQEAAGRVDSIHGPIPVNDTLTPGRREA